jgi:phosphatidate cytidylyltransferase
MARARRFDWNNLRLRIVSGLVLATAALAVTWFSPPLFLVLVAVAVSILSFEWAMMAAPASWGRLAIIMTIAGLGAVFLTYTGEVYPALGAIALGTLVAGVASRGVTERRADAAYGVLYIAPACMAIVWLRVGPPDWSPLKWQGAGWTVMLLATTWAADICAYAAGNVFKGPKLWPRYSPNKTWSGFFGGLAGAAAAAAGVAALLMHLSLAGAGLIGLSAGLATMMGDLWESMLKRRFGVKDSGDLIPGHGGLLDRVDGLMFATVVFAAARMIVRYGWAH